MGIWDNKPKNHAGDDRAHAAPKNIRLGAILVSLFAGILILLAKIYAAHIGNSSALRSDALEGTVNVLAAAFGLGSVIFSEKPADKDHPYGHGKIEYFASAFEGGLIALAGFLIVIDTVIRVISHAQLGNLGLGLELNVLAGLLNGVLGIAIYSVGRKYESQILVADGIHLLTDLVSTVVLALGLAVVLFTGWSWLDPALAIGVALFLFRTGFILVRESAGALLDAENPELIQKIVNHFNQTDRGEVITIHELKAQQFGRDKHVDMHVVVPEFLTIKQAHDLSDRYAMTLTQELGHGSITHTHVDPCERSYCVECPSERCPVREADFVVRKLFTVEEITLPGEH